MKKLTLLLAIVLALSSCEKEESIDCGDRFTKCETLEGEFTDEGLTITNISEYDVLIHSHFVDYLTVFMIELERCYPNRTQPRIIESGSSIFFSHEDYNVSEYTLSKATSMYFIFHPTIQGCDYDFSRSCLIAAHKN